MSPSIRMNVTNEDVITSNLLNIEFSQHEEVYNVSHVCKYPKSKGVTKKCPIKTGGGRTHWEFLRVYR